MSACTWPDPPQPATHSLLLDWSCVAFLVGLGVVGRLGRQPSCPASDPPSCPSPPPDAAATDTGSVGVHAVLIGVRLRVGRLLRLGSLDEQLRLARTAAPGEAAVAARPGYCVGVLVGLGVVRRRGVGRVAQVLRGGARPAANVHAGLSDRSVGVDAVLIRVRRRVGVLIGTGELPEGLGLTGAAATGEAAVAARLVLRRVLVGLGVVRRRGIGRVVRGLVGGAVATVDVHTGNRHRSVGVDAVLIGVRLGVGLLARPGPWTSSWA